MEILSINSAEDLTYSSFSANQQWDFNAVSVDHPGPADENEEDENNEEAVEKEGNDDPPLDEDIVHSPVTTQTGGMPKK